MGTDSPDGLVADIGKISLDDKYMLIAAIDFGTTFSAYAFSFRYSPTRVYFFFSSLSCFLLIKNIFEKKTNVFPGN